MVAICMNKELINFRQIQNEKKLKNKKINDEKKKKDLEIKSINRIINKKMISNRELNFLIKCKQIDLVTKIGIDFIDFKIVNKYLVFYNDRVNLIYC